MSKTKLQDPAMLQYAMRCYEMLKKLQYNMLYNRYITIDGSMVVIVSDGSIIHALDLSRSLSATL